MPGTSSVWPSLLWTLQVIALWVVASIPAYAVLSVLQQLRGLLTNFLRAFSAFAVSIVARLQLGTQRLREELQERMRWYEIDATAQMAWRESMRDIYSETSACSVQLQATIATATRSLKIFTPIVKRLKQLRLASGQVPAIPELDAALDSTRKARLSLTNFIVSSVLLVPIFFANAQLTGLVLGEIIGPAQPILGFPVAFVIATVLVIIEAGLGLLHSNDAESRHGTERMVTIGGVFWTIVGGAVIATEGLLYSTVDSGTLTTIPVVGSVFGLIGALLGLAVFGLGRLWHHSLIGFRNERTPKAVRKELQRLKYAAEEWNGAAERLLPHQDEATTTFGRLAALAAEATQSHVRDLGRIAAELERHRLVLPAWASATERALTDAEFHERESRSYLWLAVALLASAILTALGAALGARLSLAAGGAVGLGTAIASFAAGVFSGQMAPKEARKRVLLHCGMAGIVLLISLVAARYLRGDLTFHIFVLSIPAIALFFSGVQIGPDVALLRLPLWFFWRSCVSVSLFLGLTITWALNLVLLLIEYAFRMIAWPMTTLVGLFQRRGARSRPEVEVSASRD